jgi:hypothetical protein
MLAAFGTAMVGLSCAAQQAEPSPEMPKRFKRGDGFPMVLAYLGFFTSWGYEG